MKSSRVDKAMMETRRSVPVQPTGCTARLGDPTVEGRHGPRMKSH